MNLRFAKRLVPAAFICLAFYLAIPARAGTFQLVTTVDPSVTPASGGGGDSLAPIISADGRYVLFTSTANNLVVDGNTNLLASRFPATLNIFLRDRTNATTTLVSANFAGTGGCNRDAFPLQISANGRYVLFESTASDLVPGDTNNNNDIFVRDLLNGTNILVSVAMDGTCANGSSSNSVMTSDGHYIAFSSTATNLVAGDINTIVDVFVRDLQAGTTALVSVGAMPASGTRYSDTPDITPDGRYVVFASSATNLVPGVAPTGNPPGSEIYVRDLVGQQTLWASTNAQAVRLAVMNSASGICYNQTISDDGQFVVFETTPLGSNNGGIILRYNLATGITDTVSTNANGTSFVYPTRPPTLDITPDGRFITFVANAHGNFSSDTCVQVWDSQTSATALVSGNLTNGVSQGSHSDLPTIDSAGRYIAFITRDGFTTPLTTNVISPGVHLYVRDTQTATTTLVDADANGVSAVINPATVPRMSADGRYVAFEYSDGTLVPNDSNRFYDVVVRDLTTNTFELISAHLPAFPSSTLSGLFGISSAPVSNGRYVAFASAADQLVPNDTNGFSDIFVHDLVTGTNILVSVDSNSVKSGNGVSINPGMSADGRYVVFTSSATNLVAGDANNALDVFIRDMAAGVTRLVSINTISNGPGNGASFLPTISTDGRFVLFHSQANNLANGQQFAVENILVRDLQTAKTYFVARNTTTNLLPASMTPDGHFVAYGPTGTSLFVWNSLSATNVYTNSTLISASGATALSISPDGNRIAYGITNRLYGIDRVANSNVLINARPPSLTNSALRFSGDSRYLAYSALLTNGFYQVFLYDFQTRSNFSISQSYTAPGNSNIVNGTSDSPDISPDGRFIAFRSFASNIVPGDTNGVPDVFMYDRLTGATTLLSTSLFGNASANSRSLAPVFSTDGQTLLFQSWASDILPQDFNQNSELLAYQPYNDPANPPPFQVTIIPIGSGSTLTWPAVTGRSYRVQFKNNLTDLNWQDITGSITLVGSQGFARDSATGTGQRFYRVVSF